MGIFESFKQGLTKTRQNLFGKLEQLFSSHSSATEEFLDELETILISSDVGVDTSLGIVHSVSEAAKRNPKEPLSNLVKNEIINLLNQAEKNPNHKTFNDDLKNKPYVVIVVGVNGSGKTTTIAKLANAYKDNGKSILIAAADTFRAAASEQLGAWADQLGIPIVKQRQGTDPGAVVHDTLESAFSKNTDVVLIDTAGRLHNKSHLMKELEKIIRVAQKKLDRSPDEILFVLDATTGQNGINQVKLFSELANVNGLILTKLDGTAKGGIVIGISKTLKIPIRYIGIGEKITDLKPFDANAFAEALLSPN